MGWGWGPKKSPLGEQLGWALMGHQTQSSAIDEFMLGSHRRT